MIISCPLQRVLERLEPRALFSVDPTITSALPVSLVATVKNTASVSVRLTNSGAVPAKGAYTINFYASSDQTLDPGVDTLISTFNKSLGNTPEGASKTAKFKLGIVPAVPVDGAYYILADVTGAINSNVESVSVPTSTVAIANPFIDLSDTVTLTSPAAGKSILPGKPYTLAIDVTNNGNVPAVGNLPIDLATSFSYTGSSPSALTTFTKHINIAVGKTTVIKLTSKLPLGTAIGDYYYIATLDTGTIFSDTALSNNIAITPTALDVSTLYPDIQNTYSGTATITGGGEVGESGTLTADFTNESQTNGVIEGNGTLVGQAGAQYSFSISGTITTRGVFKGHALTSNGANDTVTFSVVDGELVGAIQSFGAGAQTAQFTIDPQ